MSESVHPRADEIDSLTTLQLVELMHAEDARALQAIDPQLGEIARAIDGIAELWFADAATMERVLASPDWQKVVADAREFVAGVTSLSVEEHQVIANV